MTIEYKPLPAPKGQAEIAAQLRWLAEHMADVGTSMDYFGGFGGSMAARGREMINAAHMAKEWADEIDAEVTP